MNKLSKVFYLIFILAFIILISGCMSNSKRETIYKSTVPIAIEYMKVHYNAEVVIDKYYEVNDPMISEIMLYGYLADDPEANFFISINHKTLKVTDVGGSSKVLNLK